jgi:predicted DNA-binding protein with PD1-like motif
MKSKLIHETRGEKTFVLVFDSGDEVMSVLTRFAKENGLSGARFTAIGAFQKATLGYFDWSKKDYKRNPVSEQVEVVSLVGDIAEDEKGQPKVHAHAVIGKSDGAALGGHLLDAIVRPTLELMLTESPVHLHRKHDDASGLALIRL